MTAKNSPGALVRRFGSRDPFLIAEALKIPVHRMNHPESALPGLTCLAGNRASIFLNDAYFDRHCQEEYRQDDILQVCAHELGHAILHRRQLKSAPIREYEIFNVRSTLEEEANEFAAGIRIDTEEMLDLFHSSLTLLQVASTMHVNVNLLIYKIEELRKELPV